MFASTEWERELHKSSNGSSGESDGGEGAESDSSEEAAEPEWERGDEDEDEDEDDEEEGPAEEVCILKFCRNMMDTQAEFCANQVAMALHVQVPACRLMRKKDLEWDQLAGSSFQLRKGAAKTPQRAQVGKQAGGATRG